MLFVTLLSVFILFALSIFQLLLIAGKPVGEYAWGGYRKVLPAKLRVGSVVSIALYVIFAIFLVSKAGLVSIIPNGSFLTTVMWVLTGYFVLGIFMNVISRSKKERLLMTPVALVLAGCFLFVTLN